MGAFSPHRALPRGLPLRGVSAPALSAAAAVLLLAGVAGCGGGDGDGGGPASPATTPQAEEGTAARPPSETERLDRLLAARAAALHADDPAAYAATATGVQRKRDRVAARRAARLPLQSVTLGLRAAEVRGRRARLRAVLTYRFRGVPGRFVSERRLRARRTTEGWRIAAVQGARERPPWEVAAFRAVRAPRILLLAPPGVEPAALADALARAFQGMAERLPGGRLPSTVLAVAAASSGQARRLTADIRGVRTLAAVADAAVQEEGPARAVAGVLSRRLLVVVPTWAAMDSARRDRVLAHELTHLALVERTSGRVPGWLVEGIAMHASGDDRSAEAQARAAAGTAISLRALCAPDALARLTGAGQAAAYAAASAAVHRIVALRGERALLRAYTAFGDPGIAGRPGCRVTDRVLRRTLGIRLHELDGALASP